MAQEQKTVDILEVSNHRMIAGNEKIYGRVIYKGMIRQWVGFGWVGEREAHEWDRANLPVVTEDGKEIL